MRDRDGNKHHLAIMGLSVLEFEAALEAAPSRPADAVCSHAGSTFASLDLAGSSGTANQALGAVPY